MQSGEAVKIATLTTPNEPLTLEELREMDGEPVYMTFPSDTGNQCGHWALVGTQRWGAVSLIYGCGWSSYESAVETLGQNFTAARRRERSIAMADLICSMICKHRSKRPLRKWRNKDGSPCFGCSLKYVKISGCLTWMEIFCAVAGEGTWLIARFMSRWMSRREEDT